MTHYTKNAECSSNKNYDKKEIEYKIFIIYNHTNNAYHASHTTQKYLSSVVANLKRKDTDNMRHLFDSNDAMIELLDVIKTDNVYYVKERIAELLHRTKDKPNISKSTILSVWKETDPKYVPPQETQQTQPPPTKKSTTKKETTKKSEKCKKPIWCQKCECEVSYTNWSRHQDTKKHKQ